uniref:Uncharacterized protein n=1 Tax=Anguilla anguilla TaxID=7936 RepID=A0A0E9XGS8_ANGAN
MTPKAATSLLERSDCAEFSDEFGEFLGNCREITVVVFGSVLQILTRNRLIIF